MNELIVTKEIKETKKALTELSKGTFCRTAKERAKYIYYGKYPELCKLSLHVINNITGLAEGVYIFEEDEE